MELMLNWNNEGRYLNLESRWSVVLAIKDVVTLDG